MYTTMKLLDELKARRGLTSDYQVSKYLGVTSQCVNKWHKDVSMSPAIGIQIAEDLELDLDAVYLSLLLEKAKHDKERELLKKMIP